MILFSALFDLVYPRRCVSCEEDIAAQSSGCICENCKSEILEDDGEVRCPRCGIGVGQAALAVGSCTYCRSFNFQFDRGIGVGSYGGTIKELLINFKFHKQLFLAWALSELLAERITREGVVKEIDYIAYVPQTLLGRISRGFNQSEILARKLSAHLKLPLAAGLLERKGFTKSQRHFSGADRIKNVKGVFKVRNGRLLKNKNVMLVDDVLTTGATANECSKVLKRAGARKVFVAMIARTNLNSDDI